MVTTKPTVCKTLSPVAFQWPDISYDFLHFHRAPWGDSIVNRSLIMCQSSLASSGAAGAAVDSTSGATGQLM